MLSQWLWEGTQSHFVPLNTILHVPLHGRTEEASILSRDV